MAYGVFAEFYDSLTKNVDYQAKADYITDIFRRFELQPECILDLACGTGTLTALLKKKGFDIFGVDASSDMLTQANQKALSEGLDILFLCQKMQSLKLYGMIDACVCTLDSICHLSGREQVLKTFLAVSEYMEKGGLFIFDVNTLYKHRNVLADNTFVYDIDEVYCVWQNYLDKESNRVTIDLDFFIPEGEHYIRQSERFAECAYSEEDIGNMLKESGFEIVGMFDDMSFTPPKPDTLRITFVAKRV